MITYLERDPWKSFDFSGVMMIDPVYLPVTWRIPPCLLERQRLIEPDIWISPDAKTEIGLLANPPANALVIDLKIEVRFFWIDSILKDKSTMVSSVNSVSAICSPGKITWPWSQVKIPVSWWLIIEPLKMYFPSHKVLNVDSIQYVLVGKVIGVDDRCFSSAAWWWLVVAPPPTFLRMSPMSFLHVVAIVITKAKLS